MTSVENITDSLFLTTVDPAKEEGPSEQYIATSIMFTVGMCGLIANMTAIRVVWKSKNLHNCFGYLLLLHASAEALVLCSFIFWAVPTTLFDRYLPKTTLGLKIGQLLMIFYYATLYAQLFKAINRFVAIFSPIIYRRWFSDENSKFVLLAVIFFSLLHGILYFFPGCNFYYDGDEFGWVYDDTPCYDVMAIYVDFIIGCSIMGITMFIDTYLKMTSVENITDSPFVTTVYPKDKEGPSEQYVATFLMFTMATCGLIANMTAIRII
ncbi:hypothetical protein FO519_005038 [Halicephalobus sp. NKZ332]|nr:hypothetical protein FO519_005038 [Halicephalobus sp. NKZ332]